MLGHQGGWDELLLPIASVIATLWVIRAIGRRRARPGDDVEATHGGHAVGTCAFCGAALPPDAERCGACGFRVER